jgi:UDP-glucose:(heptosyl)LPS alpha-1,3-glucosyltransferase
MKLAFVLFRYFPYGGLERDMLAMARLMKSRGHDVTIYCSDWKGEKPELPLVILPVGAMTNHSRNAAFVKKFQAQLPNNIDAVIGFNKMPGLDFYYAADVCFAEKVYKERGLLYRWMPRARSYLAMEDAVFSTQVATKILMISTPQIGIYQQYYRTPDERFYLLPPGIRRERIMPDDYLQRREQLRQQYQLAAEDYLLMMVGSDFRRKGLDRSIRGLAALSEKLRKRCHLWVAGQDKAEEFNQLAARLGVAEQVKILGGRDDVSELLWAADALLHPAYSENTGTALLEGMVAGLPVIATETCGYSHYITEQKMGVVLSNSPDTEEMAAAMTNVLAISRDQWRERAKNFITMADIFSMTQRAAEIIEQQGKSA